VLLDILQTFLNDPIYGKGDSGVSEFWEFVCLKVHLNCFSLLEFSAQGLKSFNQTPII
jgi:hypothetical protein